MAITSVSLKNFQGHRKTLLELHKGVNVITGPSASGKSAVIRALKWVATNRPVGNPYVRHGRKSVVVTIVCDKGSVQRGKDKRGNYYCVNGDDLKAFGQSVPSEVQDVLQLDEVNMQSQHDPHFLLSDSSGAVTERLNRAADLSLIDHTLSNLNSKKLGASREAQTIRRKLDEAEQEAQAYEPVDELRREIEGITKADAELESKKVSLEKIENGIDGLVSAREFLNDAPSERELRAETNDIQQALNRLGKLCAAMVDIEKGITGLEQGGQKLIRAETGRNKLEKQYSRLVPDACPLCGSEM